MSITSFKKIVLKFYDVQERHNPQYANSILNEFKNDPNITYIRIFKDHDNHVGYHYNCLLKHKSYKTLYEKWSKKETKDKRTYMFIEDIKDTDEYVNWIIYCSDRERINYKQSLPYKHVTIKEMNDSISDDFQDQETFDDIGHKVEF